MEDELKDYVLLSYNNNPALDVIIDLVRCKKESGMGYRAGGLLDQPYFMTAYVECWVNQALAERRALEAPQKPPMHDEELLMAGL
jgi:hypothetical protein